MAIRVGARWRELVSMESGLEDRNNCCLPFPSPCSKFCLNGVRPRRPEQFNALEALTTKTKTVSMESGLEDRNNGLPFLWRKAKKTVSQWSPA